ncbi:neo-calmodulin-like isoform X1 [Tigriopus californicus]|uniref:neo-calmodulin-like isoform X1 n=1 Tax=Tigriopus californicus TaxID=6832 RepID=UPI0027D9EFA8|nr:neo-calmodulin-like isoform X1 [Tigriopus californicus]
MTKMESVSQSRRFMGTRLSEHDFQACFSAFQKFDKDDSGAIDTKELTSLLRSMGQNPTDSQVHDMINEIDVDGSGVVEFEEFVKFITRLMKNIDPENEVREAYRRFDPDNEGVIRVEELRFVLSNLPVKLSKAEIEEMILAANPHRDGQITFSDFRRLIGI